MIGPNPRSPESNLAVSVERLRRVQFSSSQSSAVAIAFDFASFGELLAIAT